MPGATAINRLLILVAVLLIHGVVPTASASGEHAQETGRPTLVYTQYTDASELFVEFPALVAGEGSQLAAHVTRLAGYRPVREGVMNVRLMQDGDTRARFRVDAPARPGIFSPVVTPRDAGVYRMMVTIDAPDLQASYDLGEVTVFAAAGQARGGTVAAEGAISYLKEQQWQGGFGTHVVDKRRLKATVYATAQLRAPADRTAQLRAPAAGLFMAYGERFPVVGTTVAQGERIGTLRARLGSGVDLASLRLAVERAAADLRLARHNLERLQGLLADGAVAAHRVAEADNDARVARAELQAARARLDQYEGGASEAGVPLITPIGGRIVDVSVAPGEFVSAEQVLLQIVGGDKRWLEARIPEADADRLRQPTGAWFEHAGERKVLTVGDNARLVTAGGVVDPVSRTVPVIFEFEASDATALIGRGLDAQVYTGETVDALAVPRSAIIDDGGQPVVYVQTGGETFARRPVRLGLRGVDYIAVEDGLEAGARVVDRGAYQVRLAAASPAEAGHGHAH